VSKKKPFILVSKIVYRFGQFIKQKKIMKKFALILISGFALILGSCSSPTLCDCLTAPGGDPANDNPSGCKKVFEDRYGTASPSSEQMENDYYECKG
jgi:hypothetical protein